MDDRQLEREQRRIREEGRAGGTSGFRMKFTADRAKPHQVLPHPTAAIPRLFQDTYQLPVASLVLPSYHSSAIMSLFRARIAAFLRPGRVAFPVNARFVSSTTIPGDKAVKTSPSDAPTTPHGPSEMISKESPSEAMARHQPDYNATVDHGTSYGPDTSRFC